MTHWNDDPAVLKTRQWFKKMEEMDTAFLDAYAISPYDKRLGPARRLRLEAFENACRLAVDQGVCLDDQTWTELFSLCQDLAFKKNHLLTAPVLSAEHPQLLALVMAGFK